MLRLNPLAVLGSSRRLLSPASARLPMRFNSSEAAPPPSPLSDGEQLLKSKLENHFEGAIVQVQDVSGGCGSFYSISIVHPSFKGLMTIKQHRLVNEVLKDEIKDMHGLQLVTRASL